MIYGVLIGGKLMVRIGEFRFMELKEYADKMRAKQWPLLGNIREIMTATSVAKYFYRTYLQIINRMVYLYHKGGGRNMVDYTVINFLEGITKSLILLAVANGGILLILGWSILKSK